MNETPEFASNFILTLLHFHCGVFSIVFAACQYQTPITQGQLRDASPVAVALSRRRVFILQQQLAALVLRRTSEQVLTKLLPPKHETAVWCALSPLQAQLRTE